MSFEQIVGTFLTMRPIERWPGVLTPDYERQRSPFMAPWSTTMKDLRRELGQLEASSIVLQIALREDDFRIDGLPRSRAAAEHPGVILSFDSKWGPLQYATDTYRSWEANVRAIALAMEALRAVDRYGVSKSGEQYRGWRQLTTGSDPAGSMTVDDARGYINDVWDGDIRRALFATHPDRGGDANEFRKVQRARELLGGRI